MAKYLDSNGLSHLIGKIKTALAGKSDTGHTHTDLVNNVSYDSTSKKIQQTKGTTTTDVVALATVATSGDYDDLTDKPTIPSAGTGSSYPAMDGTRALGSNAGYARVDHVHPTDTSRAPTSHAASSDTYGKGTSSNYGHVKLSDATNGTAAASSGGTAATPKAVADAVALIPSAAASTDTPVMDGTAAVGTSTKWAKADHVHPTDTSRAASSHAHGNITSGGDITATAPTIASGDKLIINDESASKVTNGPSFGTDTTKFLRNDGTWDTPAGTSYSDFTGATATEAGTHGLVPAPGRTVINNVLSSNGSWKNISKVIWDSRYGETDYGLVAISEGPAGHDPDIVMLDASYLVLFLGTTPVNRATADASGNNIASTYATKAELAGSATFQGTLVQTDSGSSATKWTQAELEAASYKKGWYWVVEAAGTYAGNVMEVGDMLFCVSDKSSAYAAADFTAIQNNIETLTTTEIDTIWAAA